MDRGQRTPSEESIDSNQNKVNFPIDFALRISKTFSQDLENLRHVHLQICICTEALDKNSSFQSNNLADFLEFYALTEEPAEKNFNNRPSH